MKTYIVILAQLLLLIGHKSMSQTISAKSSKIRVNYAENMRSEINITKPSVLNNSTGYISINSEKIEIQGKITDSEGIKSLHLNDIVIPISKEGEFTHTVTLTRGKNTLTFKVTDKEDEQVIHEYLVLSHPGEFTANSETEIQILRPEIMGKSRGFVNVKTKKIIIEGIVRDYDGLNELYINGNRIYFDAQGHFITSVSLQDGPNLVSFKVIDKTAQETIKEYYLNKEETEELLSSNGAYYALLIANQHYDDPGIVDLDYPLNDVEALRSVLTNRYSFEPDNIIVLKDPTREEIIDQLDFLSANTTPEDNVLIFYAGHGHWDDRAEIGYWLPKNAKKNSKAAWFRNSTLRDYIREIRTKHTLLIADACFSGSIFKSRAAFNDADAAINKMHQLKSRKAMTSGTLKEVPDKSAFMKYLLQTFDQIDEKYTPAAKLFTTFRASVMNNSPNIPQYGTVQNSGDEGGDFIFVLKE